MQKAAEEEIVPDKTPSVLSPRKGSVSLDPGVRGKGSPSADHGSGPRLVAAPKRGLNAGSQLSMSPHVGKGVSSPAMVSMSMESDGRRRPGLGTPKVGKGWAIVRKGVGKQVNVGLGGKDMTSKRSGDVTPPLKSPPLRVGAEGKAEPSETDRSGDTPVSGIKSLARQRSLSPPARSHSGNSVLKSAMKGTSRSKIPPLSEDAGDEKTSSPPVKRLSITELVPGDLAAKKLESPEEAEEEPGEQEVADLRKVLAGIEAKKKMEDSGGGVNVNTDLIPGGSTGDSKEDGNGSPAPSKRKGITFNVEKTRSKSESKDPSSDDLKDRRPLLQRVLSIGRLQRERGESPNESTDALQSVTKAFPHYSFRKQATVSHFQLIDQVHRKTRDDSAYRMVQLDLHLTLYKAVMMQNLWHTRTGTYVVALLLILFLSEFCFLYPVRKVGDLINMATTINYASRRNYLTQSLTYYTRELVLDDGFSRSNKFQIAGAIDFLVNELEMSDFAVRIGGTVGEIEITKGANDHSEVHNSIMYKPGCPWRVDSTTCEIQGMPGVGNSGLYVILRTFMDMVRSSLNLYGPPVELRDNNWTGLKGSQIDFVSLPVNMTRFNLLDSDPKLKFIMQSFDGDLISGLSLVTEALQIEAADILNVAVTENEILYAIHVIVTVLLFYIVLFRNTIYSAMREVDKARRFVIRMPLHMLPNQREIDLVMKYFHKEKEEEEDFDGADIDTRDG